MVVSVHHLPPSTTISHFRAVLRSEDLLKITSSRVCHLYAIGLYSYKNIANNGTARDLESPKPPAKINVPFSSQRSIGHLCGQPTQVYLTITSPASKMCTKVVHKYGCGHQLVETAPCANKRAGACRGITEKIVNHTEKCDRICGGWYVQAE